MLLYSGCMSKVIEYMVTWTTYGTWLQGSRRGYVKDGQVHGPRPELKKANKKRQKDKKFILTRANCEVVREAVSDESKSLGQNILAMAITATHAHMVVDVIDEPIETAVARYKRAGTKALRAKRIKGRIWTRGYDKRFCFDEKSLYARIDYVKKHI